MSAQPSVHRLHHRPELCQVAIRALAGGGVAHGEACLLPVGVCVAIARPPRLAGESVLSNILNGPRVNFGQI